jgi:hypothetical protein
VIGRPAGKRTSNSPKGEASLKQARVIPRPELAEVELVDGPSVDLAEATV